MNAVAEVKYDEFGRRRALALRRPDLAIIPGQRFMQHWVTMMEHPNNIRQVGCSVGQLDDFYRGWVEPISSLETNACSHKKSTTGLAIGASFMNASDIFDLAVNTDIVPKIFEGSDSFAYNSTGNVQQAHCTTCGADFDVIVFKPNRIHAGLELISEGKVSPFVYSLTDWNALSFIKNRFDEEHEIAAVSRFARLCLGDGKDTSILIPRIEIGRNALAFYDAVGYRWGGADAIFMTLLTSTQKWAGDDFVPTEEELTMLRDDVFARSLLEKLTATAPNKNRAVVRYPGYDSYSPGDFGFRTLMHAANSDIDMNVLRSMIATE